MKKLVSVSLFTAVFMAVALAASPLYAQEAVSPDAVKFLEFFRIGGIIPAIFFIVLATLVIRTVAALTHRLGERFTERRLLASQINTILRFLVYIFTFLMVVSSLFKLERELMLAMGGTLAVGVGFALKDLLASVFAGITLLFDRPFQVGDRVTFGTYYGEISTIGLRTVRMITLDDSVVTIPNNKFLTEVVVSGNAGELNMMIQMDFYIAQDADLARAKRIVAEAVRTSRFVFLEKPVTVLVKDLIHENYLTTRLRAKAYVLDVRYEKAFESDVTERVKRGFASAGTRPPSFRHEGIALESPTQKHPS